MYTYYVYTYYGLNGQCWEDERALRGYIQEAIEHSSEDRDPGHGFEGNRYILLRITDVIMMYYSRCL